MVDSGVDARQNGDDDQRIAEGVCQAGDATLATVPPRDIGDDTFVRLLVNGALVGDFYSSARTAFLLCNIVGLTGGDELFPIGQKRRQMRSISPCSASPKHVAGSLLRVCRVVEEAFQ